MEHIEEPTISSESDSDTDPEVDTDSEQEIDISGSVFDDIIAILMGSREPKEPFIDTLTVDDIIDMTSTVYELTDEYIREHILDMIEPQFHTQLVDYITTTLFESWSDADLCSHGEDDDDPEDDYDDVRAFIQNIINDYFTMSKNWDTPIPIRSHPDPLHRTSQNTDVIRQTIARIKAIPQPEQRTPEWYEFRHGLITASNLYKVFGSEAVRNSLIYEKCLLRKEDNDYAGGYVNTSSPMHWGQKYEPVSVMLYEKIYNSKVEEFGCIQHPRYSYIGASPDGIITDTSSDRYGRMLEIKNIVNRDITVPSKAYWVQMQMQMETCDLDECDFLETRFKEYADEDAFHAESGKRDHRGIILYFVERVSIGGSGKDDTDGYPLTQQYSGAPKYVYMPFDIELTKDSIDTWIESYRMKLRRSWSLYTTIYWYLDEMSCVLVERNRPWFESARPKIEETWNIILKERETGYEHRAVKKKIVKLDLEVVTGEGVDNSKQIKNLPILSGVCLVKLE